MDTMDTLTRVADIHNRLSGMLVQGDNAIIIGGVLQDMRAWARTLQEELKMEKNDEKEAGLCERP